MRRVNVISSSLVSAGYDAAQRALEVEFAGGAVYRYLGVPPEVWNDFLAATSKGTFVNVEVKPNYRYRKVT